MAQLIINNTPHLTFPPNASVFGLNLHNVFFDQINEEIKKEEYRNITQYWAKRLMGEYILHPITKEKESDKDVYAAAFCDPFAFLRDRKFKELDFIQFENGMRKDRRIMLVECKGISIATGNPDWGAVPDQFYFNIKLGNIVSRNFK